MTDLGAKLTDFFSSTAIPAGSLAQDTLDHTQTKKSAFHVRVRPTPVLSPQNRIAFRDIQTFYNWGFSYLKYDNCASTYDCVWFLLETRWLLTSCLKFRSTTSLVKGSLDGISACPLRSPIWLRRRRTPPSSSPSVHGAGSVDPTFVSSTIHSTMYVQDQVWLWGKAQGQSWRVSPNSCTTCLLAVPDRFGSSSFSL